MEILRGALKTWPMMNEGWAGARFSAPGFLSDAEIFLLRTRRGAIKASGIERHAPSMSRVSNVPYIIVQQILLFTEFVFSSSKMPS